ncbi:YHS domain-containing (seleno)protein [Tenacibaculum aquimarinum]|uniref:YHS domain-containing (seleno)protein n=1 Tax=Tenacibaculum aquimarinum TaxID=2910675 RepID=UPI001F0A3370|nr:YHS domain-containing (seleno)protein [Tenacibaculum aquimarinum]MCH3883819.1 hypothetical protein [Tenacibaculum aquimarinum]
MKHAFFILFLSFSTVFFAQQTDYNTKKGAVASGYDVVAYFSNQVKKGNKKLTVKHDGVTFRFSSEENLKLFKENPDKYTPQYGGYCAYAVAERNKKMYTHPEFYEIRDGKLYLFYNPWIGSALEDWQEGNVKKRQEKGDTNWKNLQHKK